MSDIHGAYKRFQRMLELIHFSEKDTLYILGDAIDCGSDGEILEYIKSKRNIVLLMGNCEWELLTALKQMPSAHGAEMVSAKQRREVLAYLGELQEFLEIEVNGRRFYLVHGYPGETTEARLYGRPERKMLMRPLIGKTVIVGHTAVQELTGDFANMPFIWHGPGILDIDCGCGHSYPDKLLACLRLEDMKEFYI